MYCDLANTIHFSFFMKQLFPPSKPENHDTAIEKRKNSFFP